MVQPSLSEVGSGEIVLKKEAERKRGRRLMDRMRAQEEVIARESPSPAPVARFHQGESVWWMIGGNSKRCSIATVQDEPVYDERWRMFVYWLGGLVRVPEDQLKEVEKKP